MSRAFCARCDHEVELDAASLDSARCPRCGSWSMQPREIVLDGDSRGGQGSITGDEFSQRLRSPLTVVKASLQHLLKHWDALADRDRKVLVKAVEAQADQAIAAIAAFEDELSAGEPRIPLERDETRPRL